ncbi:MAG: M3 family metallopeptidase [Bacteroidales bacterium]|nr:M3 family metallopeptidase [Candidatus Cryptobacteroides fimicaballi]
MKKFIILLCAATALLSSCNMENPLLVESSLPYSAPQFDKIKPEHFKPAFEQGIKEGKAEIDAIVANGEEATFQNTIEALEFAGQTLNKVAGIFYAVIEANTNEQLQAIAEEISPMMTEYSMYISLNEGLFNRVKAVYDKKSELDLTTEQDRLLDKTYKSFVRSGALLQGEDKEKFSKISEELSLSTLTFGKNVLAATNAYTLNITDSSQLAGLPQFAKDMAAQTAQEKGQEGWTFDLSAPSYGAFLRYSENRGLRKEIYMAYNTRAVDTNSEICKKIVDLRLQMANLLGYETYADYVLEERMAKGTPKVLSFIDELMTPSLPAAKEDVKAVYEYAKAHGFEGNELEPWDFSFWSEKLCQEKYTISDELLKPYFRLENCIDAVFGLATKLYGISFEERNDIPGYHEDVKVYDVKDSDGSHLALFYCDFFPRASKRGGAWMTSFSETFVKDGVEHRPFVNLVTNFSKPTGDEPALLTHDELTTFLHEFGHSLHGILAKGNYASMTGTSVNHDFVELPSQIMENWAYEPEYLDGFAKHYKTGETIPDELIGKIVAAKNYNAAYLQVRQLHFGILDMSWHTLKSIPEASAVDFEHAVLEPWKVLPIAGGSCISTTITHLFSGGYAAGYYSYKWAEVLAADAFSRFEEEGIFNTEVSASFRNNILSKGSSEDEAQLYRNFRGHDPEPRALLVKLGIVK